MINAPGREPAAGPDASQSISVDDSYRFVRAARRPVTWLDHGGGLWLITGYAELAAALRDTGTFSSAHAFGTAENARPGVLIPPAPLRAVPIELDPPDHRRARQLLNREFQPGRMAALAPLIQADAAALITARLADGRMDLLRDLAVPVPARQALRLIGLPLADAAAIADAVHERGDGRFAASPTWAALTARIGEVAAQHRRHPADDLISRLVAPTGGTPPLDRESLHSFCFTMVVGGMSTTTKLTLGALTYLAVHPSIRERAGTDDDYLDRAIEEFVRYYSPVPLLCRTATRDVVVGSQVIKRGARVGMGYAAANRDPGQFDEPDRIDLGRSPNRHLAFGRGVHACPGSGLGRLEAKIMVREVLRLIPDFRLAPGFAERACAAPGARLSWQHRLARGLPVTFTGRPGPGRGHPVQPPVSQARP
ncbi:MAG: cytochrome P450 [Streptosporangiaceae bacterium]